MKPYLQRIMAASILIRSSRLFWRPITQLRSPLPQLPLYIQRQTSSILDTNNRRMFSTASRLTNQCAEEEIKEESSSNNLERFQFVAYAAWHPKSRPKPPVASTTKKVPYWKQTRVGKVDAGEDAFFQTITPEGLALGVADGVGGWGLVGVDPALFSWTLMDNAALVAKNERSIRAHEILDAAFHRLRLSGKVAAGSSTACILNLSKTTGEMTTCNLGDSAFLLIRDKKIVYQSPSQQHYFNCPYQLTIVPDSYPNRDELIIDLPKDADNKSFFLKDGDLILLATDGYFDNMYSEETLALINAGTKSLSVLNEDDEYATATIRTLAKTLTDRARRLSLDPKRLSPWAKAAQAHGSNYRGGKVDDITCIVTLVRHKCT
ncbi:protein serine/threonine phosphatase 2C [Backusella circina FSU 941]|nr:protein serine/threonine phosphatase 2C [Backusella circina FSU 941]